MEEKKYLKADVKLIINECGQRFWEVNDHDCIDGPECEKELKLHVNNWPIGTEFSVFVPEK